VRVRIALPLRQGTGPGVERLRVTLLRDGVEHETREIGAP
jgi:hypothetical protein